jgi:hypothetical protein
LVSETVNGRESDLYFDHKPSPHRADIGGELSFLCLMESEERETCGQNGCQRCLSMHPKFLTLLDVPDVDFWAAVRYRYQIHISTSRIIKTLWLNLEKQSDNERFKTINLTNKLIKAELACVPEAIAWMVAVGWVHQGQSLVWASGTNAMQI